MAREAAVDRPLGAVGWDGSGAGSDGGREGRFSDAKCVASVGGPDGGDLFDCSPARLQWLALEARGTIVGGLRGDSVWHPEATVRGPSFRQRRFAGGIAFVLRVDLDPDSEADTIGPRVLIWGLQSFNYG